jgi:hypothetical protein
MPDGDMAGEWMMPTSWLIGVIQPNFLDLRKSTKRVSQRLSNQITCMPVTICSPVDAWIISSWLPLRCDSMRLL